VGGHFLQSLVVVTPPPATTAPPRLPVKKLLLLLGVVGTLYAAALLMWGGAPGTSLAPLASWVGLQAAALCCLNYVLRGWRWRRWMAHYGRHFGRWQGLRLYLAGYAFTPTPGNVGEAVRGLMLVDKPLSTAQGLAIFGAERLADLLCLLMLCLPALAWLIAQGLLPSSPFWLGPVLFALALLMVAVIVVLMVFRARLLARAGWLVEAWACLAKRPLAWLALTLTAWAAQGGAVWLLCKAMGLDLSVMLAAGFYALAMVAGALSVLPAGLGGTEAALTGLLVASGSSAAAALAITVLARLLTLWLAVGLGVLSLVYSAAIPKDIRFS
jgi:uncharacterized membrane protein YbhN (UPF0104 family)